MFFTKKGHNELVMLSEESQSGCDKDRLQGKSYDGGLKWDGNCWNGEGVVFNTHSRNKLVLMGIPLNLESNTNLRIHNNAKFFSLRKLMTIILGEKLRNAKERVVFFFRR